MGISQPLCWLLWDRMVMVRHLGCSKTVRRGFLGMFAGLSSGLALWDTWGTGSHTLLLSAMERGQGFAGRLAHVLLSKLVWVEWLLLGTSSTISLCEQHTGRYGASWKHTYKCKHEEEAFTSSKIQTLTLKGQCVVFPELGSWIINAALCWRYVLDVDIFDITTWWWHFWAGFCQCLWLDQYFID